MSFFSGADMIDDVNDADRGLAAERWAKFGRGRERCLATWSSLLNIRVSVRLW